MKKKLLEMNAAMYIHLCNIAFCQDKYNKKMKDVQFNKAFSWY